MNEKDKGKEWVEGCRYEKNYCGWISTGFSTNILITSYIVSILDQNIWLH
jgi:hypothetical protein